MRFEGGAQLARNLDMLSTRLSRKVQREALTEAGEPIRQTMAELAPREPGSPDLADNMVISVSRGLGKAVAIAIGPAKGFFYGFYQEFGTVHHGRQSFARPAYDRHVPSGLTIARIKASLWRALISRGFGSTRGSSGGAGL